MNVVPQYRNVNELKKLPNNPRSIKDSSFQSLCKSLQDNPDYFEARPLILSDRTGTLIIIAGNQRYDAAKYIGLKQVPTVLLTGLTEEREKEIIIRDNVSNGEWSYEILSTDWNKESLEEWGVPTGEFKKEIEEIEEMEKSVMQKKEIKPYNKTHILLSFNPELLLKIQEHIEKIIKIEGIEYEQTSN